MIIKRLILFFVFWMAGGFFSACQDVGVKQIGLSANNGSKKQDTNIGTSQNAISNNISEDSQQTPNVTGSFLDAKYSVVIQSLLGIPVCDGEAVLKINQQFMLEMPEGKVSCLFNMIQIDLRGMMKGFQAGSGTPADGSSGGLEGMFADGSGVTSDGKIIRVKKFFGANFEPARPILVSPFQTKLQDFAGFSAVDNVTVIDPQTGQAASGTITTQVVGVGKTYTTKSGIAFNNGKILNWQMAATGFEGINKPKYFLFDLWDLAWSYEPIAIPRIILQGKMKEFLAVSQENGQGNMGDLAQLEQLFGATDSTGLFASLKQLIEESTLTVTMELKQQDGLN